jgi:hypothetical protein
MSPKYCSPGRISHPIQTTGDRFVTTLTRATTTEANLFVLPFGFFRDMIASLGPDAKAVPAQAGRLS